MDQRTYDQFWSKVQGGTVDSCWQWLGTIKTGTGYGVIRVERSIVRAHRFAYEHLVGPIPDGLVLDHLCRNRSCVNPWHLEPVTIRVNTLRGSHGRRAERSECSNGHALSGENLQVRTDQGRKRLICRACNAARMVEYRAQRRGLAYSSASLGPSGT